MSSANETGISFNGHSASKRRAEAKPDSGHSLAMAQVYNSASMKRAIEKLVKDGLVYNFEGDQKFSNPFFREWLVRG